jgi:hypothetical protein
VLSTDLEDMFYGLECTSRIRLCFCPQLEVSMLESVALRTHEKDSLSSNLSLPAAPGRFLPAKQMGKMIGGLTSSKARPFHHVASLCFGLHKSRGINVL